MSEKDAGADTELDSEVARLNSLSLPELAAEVMNRAFSPAHEPGVRGRRVGEIADPLSPPHAPPIGGLSEAQLRMWELIAEDRSAGAVTVTASLRISPD